MIRLFVRSSGGYNSTIEEMGVLKMKAFFSSVIAAIVISVIAAVVLDVMDSSSKNVYQSENGSVRL